MPFDSHASVRKLFCYIGIKNHVCLIYEYIYTLAKLTLSIIEQLGVGGIVLRLFSAHQNEFMINGKLCNRYTGLVAQQVSREKNIFM